tara:strand:+ start:386 stop:607 length:222 start_codon:yes stop_codon:yes gene_type:complete
MKSKIISADIKSKSIKETKEEINQILEKFEGDWVDLEKHSDDYVRLSLLNKHVDELLKKKFKKINSLKKNVKK